MKQALLVLLAIASLGATWLYLYPGVQELNDHCTICRSNRVYYQLDGDDTFYNLRFSANPAVVSSPHQHAYSEPQVSDAKRMFRWQLHASGKP